MDEEFAGTQLYIQRVCSFLPLCLLALCQHNQCGFLEKADKENLFLFFDKLLSIDFTPFSNFNLLIFRSGKDSFIKSIFSLSPSPAQGRKKRTGRNQEEKSWLGWGLNP
jgi:hypothetical protein